MYGDKLRSTLWWIYCGKYVEYACAHAASCAAAQLGKRTRSVVSTLCLIISENMKREICFIFLEKRFVRSVASISI
jgi:hypothetical protein